MLGIIFLLTLFYIGFVCHNTCFSKSLRSIAPLSSFILGSLFAVILVLTGLLITHTLFASMVLYSCIFIAIFALTIRRNIYFIKELRLDKALIINLVLFTVIFLAFQRAFSYASDKSLFLIESNLYQDFGAHIPFIRYFSSGSHSLIEVPFFAGGGLNYHFLSDFYAAILEYLGMRIDLAVNLISSLSLVFFLNILFKFSKLLLKNIGASVLACVFFIFNSDLSFIEIFRKYGVSLTSYYHHNTHIEGNILGLSITGNFLNINVYLNQRHLIFGLFWLLYILFIIISRDKRKFSGKEIILLALTIGVFPFWHVSILIALYVVLVGLYVLFKERRRDIIKIAIFSFVLVLPQVLMIKSQSVNQIIFNPGFMVAQDLSVNNFSLFWIWNLGLSIPLAILGFIKSSSLLKRISLAFFGVFVLGNLFQFAPYMFDNHKFFNAWIISVNVLVAGGIVYLYKKGIYFKFISACLVFFLVISGVTNMLVLKNDVYAQVPDYKRTEIMQWVEDNTDKDSIFITNGEIYDPVSISGGRTFLGRIHYIYLYGGDANPRVKARDIILNGVNTDVVEKALSMNKIDYIIIYKNRFAPNIFSANTKFLEAKFKKVYENYQGVIYKI